MSHGKIATVIAVRPPSRFGSLDIQPDGSVRAFNEKPAGGEIWINGGFFVLSPRVFDYIEGASTVFEREPLESLAKDGQLMAYPHEDFWYSMDTMRDKQHLESLWAQGNAPWKIW
jgi:glucose-1-phosphate cytidylyltransferase